MSISSPTSTFFPLILREFTTTDLICCDLPFTLFCQAPGVLGWLLVFGAIGDEWASDDEGKS